MIGDIGPFGGLLEPYGDFTEAVRALSENEIEAATADEARGGVVQGMGRLGDERMVVLLDVITLARQVLL